MLRRFCPAILVAFALSLTGGPASSQASGGVFTLGGDEAAGFLIPPDVELVRSFSMERLGITYERYQQVHEGAQILGGQITIHRDESGDILRVAGAHYPEILPTNSVRVTAAGARGLVDRDIGPDGERDVTLMIDPGSGEFFWRVETKRAESRWVHWIGAGEGQVLNKFDALTNACTYGEGEGAAFDRDPQTYGADKKILNCLITPSSGSGTQLVTGDGRQETHDQGSSRRPFLGPVATHGDSLWDIGGRESPGTGALVDAHYYMAHARAYFESQYSWHFPSKFPSLGKVVIHAHFTKNYVNAFWNGQYFAFGDGDGVSYGPLTSMDVAAHEFTHAVTESTSDLIYQNESGALNESFSDIMAAVIERLSDDGVLTPEPDPDLGSGNPKRPPEWLIGEDFHLTGNGFRNMANPGEDGDPRHYDDRYTGTGDNGGVHINSGISNHAFYLLVEGIPDGQIGYANGGYDVPGQSGIPVQDAADIFYFGFTALTANSTFCDAREFTLLNAGSYPDKVAAIWDAVGVDAALCGGGGSTTNRAPTARFTYSCNNLSCTFDGSESSDPDGDTLTYAWDFGAGNSGSGPTASHEFPCNDSYLVTLTVSDGSASHAETQSVQVSGGANCPADETIHVGDLDGNGTKNGRTWTATVTIKVETSTHAAVSGAKVTGDWAPVGGTSKTCTTGANGICGIDASGIPNNASSVTFKVTGVDPPTGSSLTYNPSGNHDPDGGSNGTMITIAKP